jgi:signal transduction histidine kinase
MWLLPCVTRGGCSLRLPAADRAAALLLDVLLAPAQAETHAAAALSACPGLAIWCLVHAAQSPAGTAQGAFEGLNALARWLAEARYRLNWSDEGGDWHAGSADTTAEARTAFARLASRALAAAARFGEGAGEWTAEEADAGRLLSLVHVAPQWLRAAGLGPDGQWEAWLPLSVAERLTGLHAARDRVAVHVRHCMGADLPSAGDVHACRWLGEDRTAVKLLPQVAARLRRLAELEARLAQLVEEEKLAALAEFAAGAGHEINNPLAVISGRAQLALRSEGNPERRRELALIHAQALRIHEMIADLMLFARPPLPSFATCQIAEVLQQVGQEVAATAASCGATVEMRPPGDLCIRTDGVQLCVALRAAVENALQAVPPGGHVEVAAAVVEVPADGAVSACPQEGPPGAGRWLKISISDNGPGLAPEVRRHAFDPFYSGRAAGRGLGMGLSKCWRIAQLLGGGIGIASRVGGGTRVTFWLPAEPPQA